MMDGLHIGRLQLNGFKVILFGLNQVIRLVPAEGTVIICFEVATVELNRL